MSSGLGIIMSTGPIALLAALISVPIQYTIYRHAPEPKKQLPVTRYVLMTLLIGASAYVVGTVAGISAACSSPSAGNLCGLIGLFGFGPLLSAVAISTYAHSRARNARRMP
jgi:hypothetical protein